MTMTAYRKAIMASREELLQSIRPGMRLDKAFFLKVYGYEITWPGFAETAIKVLEEAGCSNARNYYISVISGYQWNYRRQIKEVGEWYLKECEKKWKKLQKGSEEQRRQEVMELLERKKLLLMQKSQILTRE